MCYTLPSFWPLQQNSYWSLLAAAQIRSEVQKLLHIFKSQYSLLAKLTS